MRKTAVVAMLVLTCLTVAPSSLLADEPQKDPFYAQSAGGNADPRDPLNERVDPFSGTLTLTHTDVHLPGNGGLDLNIIRVYNSMIWGRRVIVNPGLIAQNERSPVGIGWTMHMGIVRNPSGNGSGNQFATGNPVVEMPDGTTHLLFRDNLNVGGQLITKEFWTYKRIDASGIWELTLADGTVYTFEYSTRVGNFVNGQSIALCTKIQNAARNATISMTYENHNSYYYLTKITDSVNRDVNFTYDYDLNRLNQIDVDNNNRTFRYTYQTIANGSVNNNYLTSFQPPVGNPWTYQYDSTNELTQLSHLLILQ